MDPRSRRIKTHKDGLPPSACFPQQRLNVPSNFIGNLEVRVTQPPLRVSSSLSLEKGRH